MTPTTRQPVGLLDRDHTAQPKTNPTVPDAQPAPSITLSWDLATRAGAGVACNGHAQGPDDRAVAIELTIEPTSTNDLSCVRMAAKMHSGTRAPLWTRNAVRTHRLNEKGFAHLDVEGVLACTYRAGEAGSPRRPIYARCPLLAELGIPAGSYALHESTA